VALALQRSVLTRFWVCVPAVAACHFCVQLLTLLMVIGATMARFDSAAAPSALDQVFVLFNAVVNFPLVTLARWLPLQGHAWIGWFVYSANSLLWGIAVWLSFHRLAVRSAQAQHASW